MTNTTQTSKTGTQARTSAHNDAIQINVQDICSELARVLGRQLLGVIVHKGPRTIQRWIAGENTPTAADEKRLRNTYQVYLLLSSVEGDHTIRAWFLGMNPQLDDEAPAEALAADNARDVMAAARAFVNGG
jgi:hypothetical protein